MGQGESSLSSEEVGRVYKSKKELSGKKTAKIDISASVAALKLAQRSSTENKHEKYSEAIGNEQNNLVKDSLLLTPQKFTKGSYEGESSSDEEDSDNETDEGDFGNHGFLSPAMSELTTFSPNSSIKKVR